jgi:hypothetical protein
MIPTTPKERFQSDSRLVANHRKLVDSAAYQESADHAALEYLRKVSTAITDEHAATEAGFKLKGVFEYLTEFRELSEKPEPPPPPINDNLTQT